MTILTGMTKWGENDKKEKKRIPHRETTSGNRKTPSRIGNRLLELGECFPDLGTGSRESKNAFPHRETTNRIQKMLSRHGKRLLNSKPCFPASGKPLAPSARYKNGTCEGFLYAYGKGSPTVPTAASLSFFFVIPRVLGKLLIK